jgi:LmbE family N-acetylglucosaminyl deacetylase
MLLVILLAVLIIAVLIVWVVGMRYANDFSLQAADLTPFKHVLVVFPHPDDETNIAGALWRLHRLRSHVTLLVLTKGECGTPDAHFDFSLKATRSAEMRRVRDTLGIDRLMQEDLGDGQVAQHRAEARACIIAAIREVKPDLVITYDLAGLYGHEDHIACAEEVALCLKQTHTAAALWYSAMPPRQLQLTNLPTHMAKDPHFADKRAKPNLRVPIGPLGVMAKVRSIYAHASQRRSFRESVPLHAPLWFMYSMRASEYFEEVR